MAAYTSYKEAIGSLDQAIQPHPAFLKQTYGGAMFSLSLTATTTGVAAGNIVAAAAAASTQFALVNPTTSNKNLVLVKFFMGVISGTVGAGPMFHGFITTNPTAASPGGTINSNLLGSTAIASVATPWALAAGSAMTGASAPSVLRVAAFSSTNTAQASVGMINSLELLNGDIVIPPGVTWVPLWGAAGTSVLNAYSVTWYEMGL